MHRVGREVSPKWPKETRTCLACNGGQIEDVKHFILDCPLYDGHRARMLIEADWALDQSPAALDSTEFLSMDGPSRLSILLGKRIDDPVAEDRIDRAVKRFLRKAWNGRATVTAVINRLLETKYGVMEGKVRGLSATSPG